MKEYKKKDVAVSVLILIKNNPICIVFYTYMWKMYIKLK